MITGIFDASSFSTMSSIDEQARRVSRRMTTAV
jgi:hypothetical protein